jgi:hypothetical protein
LIVSHLMCAPVSADERNVTCTNSGSLGICPKGSLNGEENPTSLWETLMNTAVTSNFRIVEALARFQDARCNDQAGASADHLDMRPAPGVDNLLTFTRLLLKSIVCRAGYVPPWRLAS